MPTIQGDFRFDKRIIERNLRSGLVSQDEVAKHMKGLRDLASVIEPMAAQLERMDHQLPDSPKTDEDEL